MRFGSMKNVDGLLHPRQFEAKLQLPVLANRSAVENSELEEQGGQPWRQQDSVDARNVDPQVLVKEAIKGVGGVVRPSIGPLLEPGRFNPPVLLTSVEDDLVVFGVVIEIDANGSKRIFTSAMCNTKEGAQ